MPPVVNFVVGLTKYQIVGTSQNGRGLETSHKSLRRDKPCLNKLDDLTVMSY